MKNIKFKIITIGVLLIALVVITYINSCFIEESTKNDTEVAFNSAKQIYTIENTKEILLVIYNEGAMAWSSPFFTMRLYTKYKKMQEEITLGTGFKIEKVENSTIYLISNSKYQTSEGDLEQIKYVLENNKKIGKYAIKYKMIEPEGTIEIE